MPKTQTNKIEVNAESFYVPEKSKPQQGYYFFAYKIRITNLGEEPAKLLTRHWVITDGFGRIHEVRGDGVVGEQPYLQTGVSFEYTSFCPLETPTGNMRGSYTMVKNNGEKFDVEIPLFALVDPEGIN